MPDQRVFLLVHHVRKMIELVHVPTMGRTQLFDYLELSQQSHIDDKLTDLLDQVVREKVLGHVYGKQWWVFGDEHRPVAVIASRCSPAATVRMTTAQGRTPVNTGFPPLMLGAISSSARRECLAKDS